VDSTANVINKVEVESQDMTIITTPMIIAVIIMTANSLFKIYIIHNGCFKEKLYEQAKDLDKI